MGKRAIGPLIFGKVYPMLVRKAELKGRTKDEVDEVTRWLTGYDQAGLDRQIERGVDYTTFFAEATTRTKLVGRCRRRVGRADADFSRQRLLPRLRPIRVRIFAKHRADLSC